VRLALASDEWLIACVRRGDTPAFEAIYDRHARELLAFCVYMLGSKHDAEDAVQTTFASAYRALRADGRPVTLRPWLFTIARNECVSILRRRRPVVELNGEVAPGPDPVTELELREEVRKVFEGLRGLPDNQRAALVLAEVHGLSQQEIGGVLGVRADQVKAFVYQARSTLISERRARDADCHEIREELSSARGAALLRGRLRRHVRSCPDCKLYADGVARQRRQLGALLPIVPSLALKYRALEEAIGIGSIEPGSVAGGVAAGGAAVGASVAGTAAEVAGGGMKMLVCKVAAGVACLGAGAGVGVAALESPSSPSGQGSAAARTATGALVASSHGAGASGGAGGGSGSSAAGGAGGSRGARGGSGGGSSLTRGGGHRGAQRGYGPAGAQGNGRGGGGGSAAGGDGSWRSGRAITAHEHEPAGGGPKRREVIEKAKLRREISQRKSREHRLKNEEPKIGSGAPPSEQELAEKKEQRQKKLEERGPKETSRGPQPTPEEEAEKREQRKRLIEERRGGGEEAPAP
jgi:RNA polymerase sigma factor (sigma-70 family)